MSTVACHYRLTAVILVIIALVRASSAVAADDSETGFESLFDGSTLAGWDGDSRFWRVEEGRIIGQTTNDNKAEHNTFLIFRGREFGDFELRFQYQVTGYNSGVQYRSVDEGNWVVGGYQADFEDRWHTSDKGPTDTFSGMFFEERGRMFLGQRGQAVIVRENPADPRKPLIEQIGSLGDPAELELAIHRDDWNDYRIVARGFQFTHVINNRVMAIGIDEDRRNRRENGIIAFQLHAGPPMQIQLRNIRIREFNE